MRKEAMGPVPGDSPDVVQVLRERLVNQWRVLEGLLARTEGPWLLARAAPTLADLAAIPLAVRLAQWKPELAPDEAAAPGASAWLQALRDRPSAAEVDRKGEPVRD